MAKHTYIVDPTSIVHTCGDGCQVAMNDTLEWTMASEVTDVADISSTGVLFSRTTIAAGCPPASGVALTPAKVHDVVVWFRNERRVIFGTLIIT